MPRETMRLLVNHQLIPIAIQPKSILLNKSVIKDLKILPNFTALSSFFDVKRQRPKTNLENATNVVLALKFLWTSKFVFP